jgi:microcystin-dependent protein
MSTPYLCEIRLVSFNFAPKGWLSCNGQLLAISQYAAQFSLLGTQYGGNGVNNFALPNLQGRVPIHFGNGYVQGELAGETAVTITSATMPAHSHVPQGVSTNANLASPSGNTWAASADNPYSPSTSGLVAMNAGSVVVAGGSQPHENEQPYLTMNYIIAMTGIFPSRS